MDANVCRSVNKNLPRTSCGATRSAQTQTAVWSPPDAEARRRHPDPGAILALDALDASEPGRDDARLDLDDAVAAFDQRGAVIDAVQYPALHDRRLQGCGRIAPLQRACRLLLRHRAGGFRRGRLGGAGFALLGLALFETVEGLG